MERGAQAWRWVGRSMLWAAIYDFLFAISILFFTAPAAQLLRLDLPEDLVYLRLNGIFLLRLGGIYLLPSWQPQRYRGVVAVAVIGRFLGFVYLGSVWFSGGAATFLWLGFADLAFSLLHATLLNRARQLTSSSVSTA